MQILCVCVVKNELAPSITTNRDFLLGFVKTYKSLTCKNEGDELHGPEQSYKIHRVLKLKL